MQLQHEIFCTNHHPVTLAHVAEVMAGIASAEGARAVGEYSCVVPSQICPEGLVGTFGRLRHAAIEDETRFLRQGDVLLRRLNPGGATVFEGTDGRVLPSINILVVRPGPELLPDYLAFLFDASPILSRLLQRSGVESAVSSLSPRRLGEAVIPVPPRDTQFRLANAWRASLRAEAALRARAEAHNRFRRLLGEAALRPRSTAFHDAAGAASLSSEGQA